MKNVAARAISLLVVGLLGASACDRADAGDDAQVTAALTIPGTSVLGFETAGAWAVSSGSVAQTTGPHTQGAAALRVTAPQNYTTLVSVPLVSGLAPLTSLTDSGATLLLDMQMPTSQPNPYYHGAIQLYISVPSKGVHNQYLGQTELTGQQLGTFQTYQFPVTDFVRSKLAGRTYNDLRFTIALNAPPGATGAYVFDNLRCTSPAARPVGSVPSVDLTASLSTAPPANTPGVATFATGTIQIPASFHVRVGSAGTGTARFELGFGSTTSVSCTYNASADRTAYNFASCNTQNKAGDIVAANFAKLTVVSADPAAPLTKIKAQLAGNLLGDQVGAKLVTPVPTFWGETASEVTSITQAWATAQIDALPSAKQTLSLPIPDFAYRKGDGRPVDMLGGGPPPSPLDPPFDFRGSLQNGPGRDPSGMFDAYYKLYGSIEPAAAGATFTSHFDVNGEVGVRVLYTNVPVLQVSASVDTDNGGTDAFGSVDPKTTGHATGSVLGILLFDETGDVNTGINREESFTKTVDSPPIPIWVFTVKGGVTGAAGFKVNAALAINGFQFTATPFASVSAHIFGGVDIVIASGGVDVTVQLIGVEMPVVATALLSVDTSPGVCAASFDADINGSVKLTSGGGRVDLVGTLGICPFCLEGSVNILTWPNLDLGTIPFPAPFPIHVAALTIPLPDLSTCLLPLNVNITRPWETMRIFPNVPVSSSVTAERPPMRGQARGASVPCQFVTWSSPTPGVTFSNNVGCNPNITFANSGPATLVVNVVDQFGETGSDTVDVSVLPSSTGPVPMITSPFDQQVSDFSYTLAGIVTGGNGTGTAVWTFNGNVVNTQTYTSSAAGTALTPFDVPAGSSGSKLITLTVTDGDGATNDDFVTVQTIIVR